MQRSEMNGCHSGLAVEAANGMLGPAAEVGDEALGSTAGVGLFRGQPVFWAWRWGRGMMAPMGDDGLGLEQRWKRD